MGKVQKFHVVVDAVDGTHVIAKRLTHAKATEKALGWLGKNFTPTGKDSWVGAYGDVIYLEPVKHKTPREMEVKANKSNVVESFKIYQVNDENRRNFGNEGLSFLREINECVKLERYDLVYESSIGDRNFLNPEQFLENLFREFNLKQPDDYTGRSMSVSDLVEINSDFYFCDPYGWKEVDPK